MTEEFSEKLRHIVDALAPEVRGEYEGGLESVLQAGGDSFAGLLVLAHDAGVATEVRPTACWLLGRLGDKQAVPALLSALKDHDPDTRAAAAWALGELRDKRVVTALVSALTDEHALVRTAAAQALGQLGSKRALRPLVSAMAGDGAAQVRVAAAYALGWLRDERALDAMVAVVANPNESPEVRGMAAEQLVNLGSSRAVPALIRALKDASPEVRFWAAYTLGELGEGEVVPELERLAASDEAVVPGWWSVKKEAADAIKRIRERLAGEEGT